jgi:predicted nicotinamide N-methyase
MPGYRVKFETVSVAGTDYLIRSLLDRQQYSDPHGEAETAGISPAAWPLFGQVWPSARVLALAMNSFNLADRRILEIGAGLALASLVVHKRLGDMTVSDCHPLSRAFLEENVLLNKLGPLRYEEGNWNRSNAALGRFDLIIGSDVLYERDQPALLAAFIDRHSAPTVEVLIVDPDRGNRAGFRREMDGRGFLHHESRADCTLEDGQPYKGRFLHFYRAPAA